MSVKSVKSAMSDWKHSAVTPRAANQHRPPMTLMNTTQSISRYRAELSITRARHQHQDFATVHTLEVVCGCKPLCQRLTNYVFGAPEFSQLTPRQKYVRFDWLRPAAASGGKSTAPTNATAGDEVTQLLQAAAQAAAQAAHQASEAVLMHMAA